MFCYKLMLLCVRSDILSQADVAVSKVILCYKLMLLWVRSTVVSLLQSRVPVYVGHNPGGTSVQNLLHYAQVSTVHCLCNSRRYYLMILVLALKLHMEFKRCLLFFLSHSPLMWFEFFAQLSSKVWWMQAKFHQWISLKWVQQINTAPFKQKWPSKVHVFYFEFDLFTHVCKIVIIILWPLSSLNC